MEQDLDLAPGRYAWRGGLGGFIGPFALVAITAYRSSYQLYWMLVYLPTIAFILACAAAVGAMIGVVLGWRYMHRGKVSLWIRFFVGLGLPASVFTVVLAIFMENSSWTEVMRVVVFFSPVVGLLPSLIAIPIRAMRHST